MVILGRARREEIYCLAVGYAQRANSLQAMLHCLVGADLGYPFWWTQNTSLDVTVGITGQVNWDGRMGFQVTTAVCDRDPNTVSFVYAHEVAHVLLRHYEQGSFLYNRYTKREAEADAFAYAYLYATARTRMPCGCQTEFNLIYAAIKMIYGGDEGFHWPTESRHADIKFIRSLMSADAAKK